MSKQQKHIIYTKYNNTKQMFLFNLDLKVPLSGFDCIIMNTENEQISLMFYIHYKTIKSTPYTLKL